jgi:hypothetical protein
VLRLTTDETFDFVQWYYLYLGDESFDFNMSWSTGDEPSYKTDCVRTEFPSVIEPLIVRVSARRYYMHDIIQKVIKYRDIVKPGETKNVMFKYFPPRELFEAHTLPYMQKEYGSLFTFKWGSSPCSIDFTAVTHLTSDYFTTWCQTIRGGVVNGNTHEAFFDYLDDEVVNKASADPTFNYTFEKISPFTTRVTLEFKKLNVTELTQAVTGWLSEIASGSQTAGLVSRSFYVADDVLGCPGDTFRPFKWLFTEGKCNQIVEANILRVSGVLRAHDVYRDMDSFRLFLQNCMGRLATDGSTPLTSWYTVAIPNELAAVARKELQMTGNDRITISEPDEYGRTTVKECFGKKPLSKLYEALNSFNDPDGFICLGDYDSFDYSDPANPITRNIMQTYPFLRFTDNYHSLVYHEPTIADIRAVIESVANGGSNARRHLKVGPQLHDYFKKLIATKYPRLETVSSPDKDELTVRANTTLCMVDEWLDAPEARVIYVGANPIEIPVEVEKEWKKRGVWHIEQRCMPSSGHFELVLRAKRLRVDATETKSEY